MICAICESRITLPEIERGIHVGRCPICGQGYGGAKTDIIKMSAYEESQRIIVPPRGPKGPFFVYYMSPERKNEIRTDPHVFETAEEAEAYVLSRKGEWTYGRIINSRNEYGYQYRKSIHLSTHNDKAIP